MFLSEFVTNIIMRKGFLLLFTAMFILSFALPAFAESFECVDAGTSQNTMAVYNTTDMELLYAYTENYTCPYGCYETTGQCNIDPYGAEASALYFLFPITAFFFIYMARSLKDEDWPIHILLLVASFAMLYVPFGTFAIPLSSQFYGPYLMVIVVGMIVVFYYVLKIIIGAVGMMQGGKKGA